MAQIEDQLSEVYVVIDELAAIQTRLRAAIDTALETLKGDQDA